MEGNYLTAGDLALIENRRGWGYDGGCYGHGYGHKNGMAATGIGLAGCFNYCKYMNFTTEILRFAIYICLYYFIFSAALRIRSDKSIKAPFSCNL